MGTEKMRRRGLEGGYYWSRKVENAGERAGLQVLCILGSADRRQRRQAAVLSHKPCTGGLRSTFNNTITNLCGQQTVCLLV